MSKAKPDEKYCCYCGKWIARPLKVTTEHLIPLSKGGNNSVHNKRTCCHLCNSFRSNKSFEIWKVEIKQLLRERRTVPPFSRYDLEIILINIEYLKYYVDTAGEKLYRKHNSL